MYNEYDYTSVDFFFRRQKNYVKNLSNRIYFFYVLIIMYIYCVVCTCLLYYTYIYAWPPMRYYGSDKKKTRAQQLNRCFVIYWVLLAEEESFVVINFALSDVVKLHYTSTMNETGIMAQCLIAFQRPLGYTYVQYPHSCNPLYVLTVVHGV